MASYRYSRKLRTEHKQNTRRSFLYIVLTISALLLFFFFGLPAVVKFAAILTELRSTSTPPEISDTTPPPPPNLSALPSYTNQTELEVKGSTEPGVTVYLNISGDIEELITDSEGEFIHKFKLKKGSNDISAIASDTSGNESNNSKIYTVIFDDEPPEFEITKPEDGSSFYGSKERQVIIEGITEKNTIVSVNGRQVVVDSDGSYSYATTLSGGENEFKVTARDRADNETEKIITLSYIE